MKIFAPFSIIGFLTVATGALAQGPAGPGARVDNSVGNWGQPPSGGTIPCLVAPAPSGSSNCGLPVIILGGGSGGGPVTLAAGSVAAAAYVSGSVLSGAFASGAIVDLTNIETTAGGSAPPKAASVQGITGGTPVGIGGSVSNASTAGLATSATNIGSVSYNYGFDGTVWRQAQAILSSGTLYDLGVHDTAAIAAINSPIPTQAATVTIGGVGVEGFTASGASYTENPLPGGCRAATAVPTAVTDGQKVATECGVEGKQVVLPYSLKETAVRGSTGATTTNTQVSIIASAGGSLKNYITSIQCSNSGATTSILTFTDGATTILINPAGGGTNVTFPVPLVTAAATAFQVTFGSASTSQYCSAQGYTGL